MKSRFVKSRFTSSVWILVLGFPLFAACAHDFPQPNLQCCSSDSLTPEMVFDRTFAAHGGASIASLHDVNVGIDGHWHWLITRIQPLVTDHRYRVRSQERLQVGTGVYAARYQGPAGTKQVLRTPDSIQVSYDGAETGDAATLSATALTADSFYLFLLGPLGLDTSQATFARLADARENGKTYYRLHAMLQPGIGLSARDEMVMWVDSQTWLTYRLHITLRGHKTTQSAHVDVTYQRYRRVGGFTLPSEFMERVRGPIAIKAHRWWLTGLDINRGWSTADLQPERWRGAAAAAATQLPPQLSPD